MDPDAQPSQRKRRRPALACEECRRRKIKCDQQMPCDQCKLHRNRGRTCTYKADPRVQRAVRHGTQTSSSVSLPSPPGDGRSLQTSAFPPALSRTGTPPLSRGQSPEAGSAVQALTDRVRQLEAKLGDNGNPVSASPSTTTPSSLATTDNNSNRFLPVRGVFSKSRYYGQSHWANGVDQLAVIDTLRENIESNKDSDLNRLLHECKILGRLAKTNYPIYHPSLPDYRNLLPPRDVCDQLVQGYFNTLETVYRVLDVPTFYEEYDQYWRDMQSSSTAFIMKLLLVMAIGTRFHRDPINAVTLRSSALDWIHAVQAWMNSPFEKTRINLTAVQIHCLLLLARQACAISADVVWISAGSLLRTAMHVGLHRDPGRLPKMSVLQAEVRRRLWATVLELQLQSSVDTGGPPMISLRDCDCEPPSNINDADLTGEGVMEAHEIAKPMDTFTQTSVQIILHKSFPTRLKIAKTINDLRAHFSYDATIKLHEDLTASLRSSAASLQSFCSDTAQPTNFQTNLLDLLTHRFILTLHYPFAMKARTEPSYYFSRKVCIEKSLFLLSSPNPQNVEPNGPSIQLNDFASLKLFGSGHYRGVILQANMMISGDLVRQLSEEPSPMFMTESTSLERKEMYKAIERFAELMADRVKAGETNVKGYVFSSSIVAQLNALWAGTPVEPALLEAGRKSLVDAYQWLRDRTGTNTAAIPAPNEVVGGNTMVNQMPNNYQDDDDIEDGFGWDEFMQDSRLNFDIPANWLFSPWAAQ